MPDSPWRRCAVIPPEDVVPRPPTAKQNTVRLRPVPYRLPKRFRDSRRTERWLAGRWRTCPQFPTEPGRGRKCPPAQKRPLHPADIDLPALDATRGGVGSTRQNPPPAVPPDLG